MNAYQAERFCKLFDDWASADVQLRTKNGDFGDGTQHNFIGWLLALRPEIIEAVKASVRQYQQSTQEG